jgi:hypothetical protein
MFPAMRTAILSVIFGFFLISSFWAFGESLYSYTDENGVRVFTNIPPKGPVQELKSFGTPDELAEIPSSSLPDRKTTYDSIIDKYATQYNLDPSLIRSIIATESAFNAKAVSGKGAQGLMQLMPSTAYRLGVRNAFDPEQNIKGGVKHMRYLLDTFNNDLSLSLAAYNAGENLVQRLGRVPNIPETHNYVKTITKLYGKNTLVDNSIPVDFAPSTYRYVDESGVIHLTSFPPTQKSNEGITGWALQSQLLR